MRCSKSLRRRNGAHLQQMRRQFSAKACAGKQLGEGAGGGGNLRRLAPLGAVPVMAAHVPMVAAVLEQISPELARMLTPVELSCTDNGIRMQVRR